jgi:phosphoribosylformylglycinamidine synthase
MILEAHIESAAFNNEFGTPCTLEYFGTLTTTVPVDGKEERRGYHKHIMLAGTVTRQTILF